MFKKNDKYWFRAYALVDAFIIVICSLMLVGGVVILALGISVTDVNGIVTGTLYIVGSIAGAFVMHIVYHLALSLYLDIKLIRNKMYGIDNGDFDKALSEDNSKRRRVAAQDDITVQIRALKQLFDDVIITKEEFEIKKQSLLNQ